MKKPKGGELALFGHRAAGQAQLLDRPYGPTIEKTTGLPGKENTWLFNWG